MATQVILESLTGAGLRQRELIEKACNALEGLLNRDDFYEQVISAAYRDRTYVDGNGSDTQASPELIVSVLKGGVERNTGPDAQVNLQVRLVKIGKPLLGKPRTMGWTSLGRQPIHTGYWYIIENLDKEHGAAAVAGHLLHEWLHIAGFRHRGGNSAREDVPYVIGTLVKNLLSNAGSRPKSAFDTLFEESLSVEIDPSKGLEGYEDDPEEFPM